MKKLIYALAICSFMFVKAQIKEGVITYEQVINLDVNRFPPEIRKMISPERRSTQLLTFNEKESIYRSIKNQEDINQEVTAGDTRMHFKMKSGDENEYYNDMTNGESLEKREFFGRIFLIERDAREAEWKVTSETKMVGKYQCMQATYMRDTVLISAWFTPQIPVSIGPGEYGGLPGLILHVDVDNGRQTFTATDLDLRALSEEEKIVSPDKGKRVTKEEFEQIVSEKMEEMKEMNGGRSGFMIIRN